MWFRYRVLIYLSRYLDQETAATGNYQSNHSKVEAIPLNALLKDTASELAGLSPH